jgi:hypothetical protein
VSILDALSCPYCGAPLLKESYYFRCGYDHRFAFAFKPGEEATGAPTLGEPGGAGDGGGSLLVRVLSHPDRTEVGRVYGYPLQEGER